MDIVVDKNDLNKLLNCIETNGEFISNVINRYLPGDVAAMLDEKLSEIQYYFIWL